MTTSSQETQEQETIRRLSERANEAQRKIRILDSIKWDDEIYVYWRAENGVVLTS